MEYKKYSNIQTVDTFFLAHIYIYRVEPQRLAGSFFGNWLIIMSSKKQCWTFDGYCFTYGRIGCLSLSYMIVNRRPLGFGLLWNFNGIFTVFRCFRNHTINRLIEKIICGLISHKKWSWVATLIYNADSKTCWDAVWDWLPSVYVLHSVPT